VGGDLSLLVMLRGSIGWGIAGVLWAIAFAACFSSPGVLGPLRGGEWSVILRICLLWGCPMSPIQAMR
jgi:hypothetical protein